MVAKISSSGSLGGALAYNINKVSKSEAQILSTNKIFCSANGTFKASNILNDFETFMPERYRTENPVFHVSLNPHPDDKLSDVELTTIAEEFLERMGYGDQPYIIFKHEDIDRHHLHVVSTRVDGQGKKINDKFERRRSKDITRDLEHKYGLITAEKATNSEKKSLKKVDVSDGNIKNQVASVVRGVNSRYHFMSFTEYKAVLSQFNITAEEMKGSRYGVPFSGVVYSATDNNGNKIGNPFNSATLGKYAGVDALSEKYISSKEHMVSNRYISQLKGGIKTALQTANSIDELRNSLRDVNINVIFRESKDGRLYGVTFIDHSTGAVLNGSRLGKEYSANAIIEQLNAPKTPQYDFKHRIPNKMGGVQLTNVQRINLDNCHSVYIENMIGKNGTEYNAYLKWSEQEDKLQLFKLDPDTPKESQSQSTQEQSHQQSDSFISGGLGLFDLPTGEDNDPEEDAFRINMQKKKKKGRRM